jgi:hypothetical protein
MKNLLKPACALAFALTSVASCLAADSPWTGTWKQNLAKSKLSGDTVTYTEKPGGIFHYDAGGIIQYDFACDGKTYPTLADRTIACTGSLAAGYDFTTTAAGKPLGKSHHAISADGKTMTIHGTSMRPDGTTATYDETYKRVSGTTGLAGKWLDVKETEQVAAVSMWTVTGGALHVENPAYKQTIDAKLDGTPGKIVGPTIPASASVTVKSVGPNKLHYVDSLNGKPLDEGTWTISADGKTITEENWIPGRESEKATIVWEKQ